MNVSQFKNLLNNKISDIRLIYEVQLDALDNLSIKERILLKYTFKVINNLERLLLETENMGALSRALQDYLKKNWALIQGTSLSYTSIPQASVTQLLFQITHALLPELNALRAEGSAPISELELLMPGLNFVSEHEEYPDLAVTEVALSSREQAELAQMNHEVPVVDIVFLGDEQDKTSERYKKQRYDEVKSLRTTNPKLFDRIIHSMALTPELREKIEHWERIKDYKILLKKQEAQQALIAKAEQGLVRIEGDYVIPCYTAEQICSTHILSGAGGSLIPISVLLSDEQELPYLDKRDWNNREREYVQERLANHSALTKALVEARQVVLRLKHDKSTLLGHLTELCTHLKRNDAYEGVGQEENAGGRVYEPIRQFAEYYKTLGYQLTQNQESLADFFVGVEVSLNPDGLGFQLRYTVKIPGALHQGILTEQEFSPLMLIINKLQLQQRAIDGRVLFEELFVVQHALFECIADKGHLDFRLEEKNKIPEDLRSEIELLLTLSSNLMFNMRATENLQTCIAMRRGELTQSVTRHKALLAEIHCSEGSLAQQLQQAENEAAHRAWLLKDALSKNYTGEDQLPFSSTLIRELEIPITIDSLSVLSELIRFNREDFKALVFTEAMKQQVLGLFDSIEVLYDFIRDHSSEQVESLLEATLILLFSKFCKSSSEANYLLFAQTNEMFLLLFKKIFMYLLYFDMDEFFTNNPDRVVLLNHLEHNEADLVKMVSRNPILLKYLSESSRDNPRLVVTALKFDGGALSYASERLRKDLGLINIACIECFSVRSAAIDCYLKQDDIQFVIATVRRNVELFKCLPEALRDNPRVVVAVLRVNRRALNDASKRLREDPTLKSIMHIFSSDLGQRALSCYAKQDDIEFAIAELQKDIALFKYLPKGLRNNSRIVDVALSMDRVLRVHLSKCLYQNSSSINIARFCSSDLVLRAIDCHLSQDNIKSVIIEVKEDTELLRYLPDKLRFNPQVMMAALSADKNALDHAAKRFRKDPNLITIAQIDCNEIRRAACACYLKQNDIKFVVAEVEKNGELFKYLPERLRNNPRVVAAAFSIDTYLKSLERTLDDILSKSGWWGTLFCNYQKEYKKLKYELESCLDRSGSLSPGSMVLLQIGNLATITNAQTSYLGYATPKEFLAKVQEILNSEQMPNRALIF